MEKLTLIQSKLKANKSQYNDFGKYHYRKAEDIMEGLKPLLAQNNCSSWITDELQCIGDRYYVVSTAFFKDNATNEVISCRAFAREEESKKGMDSSQITGASSSYARKVALGGLYLIDDSLDSDTTNNGDDSKERAKKGNKTDYKQISQAEQLRSLKEAISNATSEDQLKNLYKSYPQVINEDVLQLFTKRKKELNEVKEK